MAWEERRGRAYYYRSVRRGGRVAKEYVGPGPIGEPTASLDAERRAESDQERRRRAAMLELMRWGFKAAWMADGGKRPPPNSARAETLLKRPMFCGAVARAVA